MIIGKVYGKCTGPAEASRRTGIKDRCRGIVCWVKGAVAANSERKRTARADLKSMWEIAVSVPFKQEKQKRREEKEAEHKIWSSPGQS